MDTPFELCGPSPYAEPVGVGAGEEGDEAA
jgi:hypothetical protein